MVMTDPNKEGRFGDFGGRFVPETLIPACEELEEAFREAWSDAEFVEEFHTILRDYGGRRSPLTECYRLSEDLGVRVLLKREDLNHTGSHKINNVIGQALLARRMGKSRLVAETGAGQHGVASATAAALLDMECKVYMGEVDVKRQALNVFRMQLLGAEVETVSSGSKTLKDAVNEALRDWVATVEHTHYCLGSVMGPHPYPWMVRTFHHVIGVPGVVHGMTSYLMQDEVGQVQEAESISAGLDYPGVGPEHAHLSAIGRAEYPAVTDQEVVEAFQLLSRTEGIIPALESAHALAWVVREAPSLQGQVVLLNLSGRGDKDVDQMMDVLGPGNTQ